MTDSTFTLQSRQEVAFSHDFHYSGQIVADTMTVREPGSLLTHGAYIMDKPAGNSIAAIHHANFSADWIFWIILGGFILLAMTKFYFEKRLALIFSSVFSRSSANLLIRESNAFRFQSFSFLLIIYLISITLFVFQVFRYLSPGSVDFWPNILFYLKIVGAFIAFFLIKITTIRIVGFIFKNPHTASEYIQNMFIFNLFAGIILLPLVLFIHYSHSSLFLFVSFGFLIILMILRFIRGIFVGLSDHKFSLFHLFLYLCTLEILPLIVIAKLIDKYFFS